MSGKIFISHSSKDKQIVSAFVDKILNLGLGIDRDDIFYTSATDTGVKSGEDFKSAIKENIKNSICVIQIITENYKASEICMNEMGAAWVLSNNVIPFVFSNFRFENVGFIHNNTHILKLDNAEDLFKFQDDHPELYGERKIKQSNYHTQVNEFLGLVSGNNLRYGGSYFR
ncbi:toll/interleukin-1 receptor domain-containing protein [Flavobacterium zepuense]|nr:toll/interleukin-1 receptor domain-containing protein [Flavobacterium zepuense]